MACENKKRAGKRKHAMFSLTEIEAAKQLIQLSNSTIYLDEDHHSFNSYSVQWKSQQSNDDTSAAIEDVLAEIEEDESLRRKNNRLGFNDALR
ncbi:hypothetical protein CR513_39880, partial [Mucuna pruriens]